jgi:AcrR family transcriptional regulator
MGKVDENKLQKQERLLETAFQLFTTKGIAKTSISDIVDNAGVAKGTFYLYFKDKYDIANRLIARKTRSLFLDALTQMEQVTLPTPEDRIIFIADQLLNQLQKTHMLLRFINKNLSWGIFKNALSKESVEPEFGEMFQKILGPDMSIWREPDTMIYIIIEMVGSTCHSVILDKDPMPLEKFKPALYRSIRAVAKSFRADCPED